MAALTLPTNFRNKMSKEQINNLPICKWEGPIRLIDSDATLAQAVEDLKTERILGFDTETKPVFRKGISHSPSILQLARQEDVLLFQLKNLKNILPLAQVLSDASILKVGVGLANDIEQLQSIIPFKPNGFVDLGDVARESNIQSCGLRSMAARFFGFRISKRAQCSNWENSQLKKYQIQYAATDAWVSREIYLIMNRQGLIAG
ncbi:MAG: 3'-5' exonuclease domain-containing protein 2 [Magnetococcales bacterium]|nr:3'-5' exonuclease domain-containing protein 2 [Magnetococcales bacterium]